jgi:hypothetical protein
MARSIRPQRVNHMNAVVAEFDASVKHLQDLYGAEFMVDIPQQEWHACLMAMGQTIFELFVPPGFLLISRYGPHYVGIEYQADMDEVRAVIAAQDIRLVRDIGLAVHTHPADCFGIAFEFYGGSFHDRDWPLLGGPIKSAEYWRDEHLLALTGLKGYTVAVHNLDAASAFFQRFLSAEVKYEVARPAIAAHAIGLQVADSTVEILAPAGEGELHQHLQQFGQGIRSTVFGTRDINQAKKYFAERGVGVVQGAETEAFAIPASTNLGLIFEFSA